MAKANHTRFDRRDILTHAHAKARVIMEGRDRPAQGYVLDRKRGVFVPTFPYSHALSLGLRIEWADAKGQARATDAQPVITEANRAKIQNLTAQWNSLPIRPAYTPDRNHITAEISELTFGRR